MASTSQKSPDTAATTGEALSILEVRRRVKEALEESGDLDKLTSPSPELTDNARAVLKRRYQAKDREGNVIEEPDQMFHRVAHNLAQADRNYGATRKELAATEEEFHRVMSRLDYLPNSPTLMNAGRELQMLSACFVLPVTDSMEAIFETVKQATLVQKSGGGTGFAFSQLRPEGDIVGSTGGVASGPVSFMRAFDGATEAVKQGSTRRGANMGILHVTHPDILKFIGSKEDGKSISNFNISVAVTEEWMEKVRDDAEYDLINPRTGKATDRLAAREVFDRLVEMAWKTGDPGIVFLDRINNDNPTPQLGQIESTNPCITGDTLVYTDIGLRRAADLWADREDFAVTLDGRFNAGRFKQSGPVMATGVKPVFRLLTREGYEVRVTADHRIMTDRGWVIASELESGDRIHLVNQKGGFGNEGSGELGQLLGWLVGDGTLKSDRAVLPFFCQEKEELAPRFASMMQSVVPAPAGRRAGYDIGVVAVKDRDESRVSSSRFLGLAAQQGLTRRHKHVVPESVFQGCQGMQSGFLQALFTADGHVSGQADKGVSVRLTSINRQFLVDVQRLLLNFGIASVIYSDRRVEGLRSLPDGKGGYAQYRCQAYHDLVVSKDNLLRFAGEIGFISGAKQSVLLSRLASYQRGPYRETFTATFATLVPEGEEQVFDLTEPETHSFVANGMVVHNCGEQPLLPYESCNLGSVNLSRMVRYTGDGAEIDWDRLGQVISTAVHMLDNVIDMNNYPIPQIEEMSKKTRRIGLGVMGFADLLVQLGIPYDSEEALEVAEEVMDFIKRSTDEASVELAKTRGVFPAWEGSIFDYPGGPRMRNSAPTTIAPTGTISIISGCSSGIEPLFALSYVRNVMDNTRLVEGNPFFEAVAQKEGFYSQDIMEALAEKGSLREIDGGDVPGWARRLFATSHDISPEWHVRMQAAFQKYTDNAVSKTINFPSTATTQDIADAYMLAYDLGCKGITIYRDGSKENQVLSTGETGNHPAANGGEAVATVSPLPAQAGLIPRARPQGMEGITERIRTGHGNMYITINFDEGKPFEVFTTLGKAGGCDSAQLEAISRLVSLALRSGIDIREVIEQLRGITCCPAWDNGILVRSAPDAVALALERHPTAEARQREIAEAQLKLFADAKSHPAESPAPTTLPGPDLPAGRQQTGSNGHQPRTRCPDCNAPVAYQEGCLLCAACGWNKCG